MSMDFSDRIRKAMQPVGQAFDAAGVSYAVVGSVAGLSHGWARQTMDVDVLAALRPEDVAPFVAQLGADYFVDEHQVRDAVRHKGSFNIFHVATGFKIDVFVSGGSSYDKQVTARRELETMRDDVEPAFYVQSAEDLLLSKLRWYRAGGGASDRQWCDILGVLNVQQFVVDFDYLDHWARDLGVTDLLHKALDEAGLKEIKE